MTLTGFIMSFLGGAFGSCIGGGNGFVVCGVLGLLGLVTATPDPSMIFQIGFGWIFVPCCCYAAGVCAQQYALRRGYFSDRNDINFHLIKLQKYDVIAVGGLFGMLGYVLKFTFDGIGLANYTDTGAMTVFLLCCVAKLLFFPKPLIGKVPEDIRALGGRFSPAKNVPGWGPYANTAFGKLVLGAVVGGVSAYLTQVCTQSGMMAAGASLAGFLIFTALLPIGLPPLFNIAMVAGLTYTATNSIAITTAAGVLTIFIADWLTRLFFHYSTGYLDCIAASIFGTAFLTFGLFPRIGLYQIEWLFPAIVLAGAIVLGVVEHKKLQALKSSAHLSA